jgi:AraC-like DNA-binding protein
VAESIVSPFPHLSWISFQSQCPSRSRLASFQWEGCVHAVTATLRGHQSVRWTSGRSELRWTEDAGTLRFTPADGLRHVCTTTMSPDFAAVWLLIPRSHLEPRFPASPLAAFTEPRRVPAHEDPELWSCIMRFGGGAAERAAAGPAGGAIEPDGTGASTGEEAARTLLCRLAALAGARRPLRHPVEGMFDRDTLARIVDHIDGRLRYAPSLGDMTGLTGLSPSHFARKFRTTTGVSLYRFIHRRRMQVAATLLADDDTPLARMAHELGFCSQSHFTRIFHAHTGMTPARYRAQFGRAAH